MKVLPTVAGFEDEMQIPTYNRPKIRSRRYPVKVMYLGVVACPLDEHDFDGRIFLKRVSRRRKVTRASRNSRFSIHVEANEQLLKGGWRTFVTEDPAISVNELREKAIEKYDLDEFVGERLTFYFETYTGTGNKNIKNLKDDQCFDSLGMRTNKDGEQVQIELNKVNMCVMIKKNDEIDEDASCDSRFMLECIPEVGQALREKFHWIPIQEKIYLVMDNAGGHGTSEAIDEYTNRLKEYNVEIIWQVPRSPETNLLDLGVWMSMQSAVERVHYMRRCQHDALAKSVEDAWEQNLNRQAFKNVHGRLRVVMRCILDDDGGNNKVEQKRGKLFRDATIIDLTLDDDEDNNNDTNNEEEDIQDDCSDDEMI